MTEKDRLAKEWLLLEKERELMKKQATEVRDECRQLQYEYERQGKKPHVSAVMRERYSVKDFINLKDDNGYSAFLRDAITFCETRDGCPFYDEHQAANDQKNDCHGIWIKMGATCQAFADRIKRAIKEKTDNASCRRLPA
ncbi:MAG: hypothetical protein Q6373_024370 [Candidatus Sigynarchaeota archaeon]